VLSLRSHEHGRRRPLRAQRVLLVLILQPHARHMAHSEIAIAQIGRGRGDSHGDGDEVHV
jgi:hypothetical protein